MTDAFAQYRASRPGPSRSLWPNLFILLIGIAAGYVWHLAAPKLMSTTSIASAVSRPVAQIPNGVLTIIQLDVGQGDAAFIRTPSGKNILIDCGEGDHKENEHSRQYPAAREVVIPFLAAHGIYSLDMLILTHPDSDHGGGMAELIDWLYENGGDVKLFLDPGVAKAARFYKDILTAVEKHNIKYMTVLDPSTGKPASYSEFGGTLIGKDPLGDPSIAFQILGPINRLDEANNNSIVTRIQCGEISFLSAGDAEVDQEDAIALFWGQKLRSTIHFAPHHGSKTSDQPNWLRLVNPEIITTSSHPPVFGHPPAEVLEAWRLYIDPPPKLYLRTDLNGDIWFRTDGKKLAIRTQFEVKGPDEQWKPAKRQDWKPYRRFEPNAPTTWEDCKPVPGTDSI